MNLIRLCIDRPVAVAVGVLLVVLFGLLSVSVIPVQLTPNVDTPVMTVTTEWTGANPQEVEREIVDRQEEQLRSVKGLLRMTSVSQDNMATIKLEFYPDIDKIEAVREINDKLRQVTGYPPEVDEPTLQVANADMDSTIAWLILKATGERDPADLPKLRDFAEDFIQPYLDRVPGVASTDVFGGLEREIQVRIDAGRLAARGLTLRQVELALRRQNQNVSAGTRAQGKRDVAIRAIGQFESLDEIRNSVIASTAGGPVYVRDVAEVVQWYKDPQTFVRSMGEDVLAFPVRREVGANIMSVMEALRGAVARVNDEVLRPRKMNLELRQVYDQTIYINQSIEMVKDNIVYGSALVLGLLLAFLRSWRATVVLALTIPVSIIGTFLVIALLGRTLNVISLAGIAFAVGDVVDSAYVVLENIFRHKQMGKPVRQAVLEGTHEVRGAVLASTLTTMAVFVPVIFVQQEAGQLFRDISIAEVAAVGLSMLAALTVIPPLAARLLRTDRTPAAFVEEDGTSAMGRIGRARPSGRRWFDPVLWLAHAAAEVVDRLNRRPAARTVVIATMCIGSLVLAWLLIPEPTYLPAGNQNLVFGVLMTPPGYSIDEYKKMAAVIENGIAPYWSVQPGSPEHQRLDEAWTAQIEAMIAANQIPDLQNPSLGRLERDRARREWLTPPPLIENFFFVVWNGTCFMGATSRDAARVKPLVRLLQTAGQRIPGVMAYFDQMQIFTFGSGNTVEINIRGDNLAQVTQAAQAMQMACMQRYGWAQPDPMNYDLGRPEVQIVADRERAGEVGLNAADIGQIIEACGDGAYVGDYRQFGGDTIDIALYFRGEAERPTRDIGEVPIYTPSGRIVPLRSAAKLIDTDALQQINHSERQRSVTLTVTPPESLALDTVVQQIKKELEPALRESRQIHDSVSIAMTGNADKLIQARNALVGEWKGWTWESARNIAGGRFFLSVVIVYLLMCALYESWLYPFVIMFSVPLAILGGFLGLTLAHWGTLLTTDQPVQQLDVLTFLGFVMLVGLVVKNAILLVEQSLVYLRNEHMPIREAVRQAVAVRVRPVLMTSLTSVVGLLPLAFMPGAGSELYRGLAAVILGGMIVSTAGTLVLVPLVLTAVIEAREQFLRLLRWAPAGAAAPLPEPPREP